MKAIKTKIIATIGPSTNTYDSLKKLHKAGMNVARINMSHATHTDAQNIIDLVQQINSEQSVDHGPIGLLLDTQGPEIRTGTNQSDMDLTVGDIVNLTIREDLDVETSSIQINYKGLIKSVSKGSRISLDNGLINFKVLAKDKENLTCKVLDGGKLGSKRHVNLPGVRVDLPSITKKDRKDILLAIKNNVNGLVRNLDDGRVEIIAEGETQNIDNLVTWCKTGPANSRVDKFELLDEDFIGEFENFEVRY